MNSAHRILFVAHSAQRGGAEYCLDTTLRHLDRERFEPVVVFPHEGPLADSAREMGCEVIITSMCHWLYFKKNWWYWKNLAGRMLPNVARLTRIICARKIDVVYSNTSAIFEPALAARRAKVPHLWHIHEVLQVGNAMSQLLPVRWVQRFIRRYSSLVVFESHAARSVFEKTTPLQHAEVVYNSLRFDPTESTTVREEYRQTFGLKQTDRVIGFVGQFIKRKNPLLLIEALSLLPDLRNAVCLFAGDGPLKNEMQATIADRGLSEVCRLLPFQTDISPFLHALDVLALPSRQESFGLVLLEAGACRKPAIACRSQGPDEIIVHESTGLLVEQADPAEFAVGLRRLLGSDSLRQQMGEASRARVLEQFHPESNTRRLEMLTESLLSATSVSMAEHAIEV